jgi:hypothetical protein
MSKDEVKGLDADEKEVVKTIIIRDSPINNIEFYGKTPFKIPVSVNDDGTFYIKGQFCINEKQIKYSRVLTVSMIDCENRDENDNKSDEHNMICNDPSQPMYVVNAEAFAWFIEFTNLFLTKEEHYNPPKPANPNILEGFTRKIKGRDYYSEKEVAFYNTLNDNIPLTINILKMCHYLDIEILMYNCAYVLASYTRRTPALEIIKHFKDTGVLAKDAKITNDVCEDCDDEPIPEDH